eukprot:TRINITY_DN11572_c0_g1_i1.p2 TRINITY_DN11572_c0_g1~~TRINITY_DN11572_c0_g1_i1.p2  ORF type:complete len:487 (-),score=200.13 TRINITY_DN11572_c0_g1_i1:218-1642(-)
MMRVLVALVIFSAATALPSTPFRLFKYPKASAEVQDYWFTQKLSHFQYQNNETWQQRYFINDTFWNPEKGGPIFLMVGGEGAIDPFLITDVMMLRYAQQYGALCFCLEHRFYGKSMPLPDLSTPNLNYLNSQEALADLALFIVSMKQAYNVPDAPVVTFGGSYPGNLAAWFRIKYPHLTIGSIASSAPVQATLDFFQYLDVVDQSLSYFTGPACDAAISKATAIVQNMLTTQDGTAQLEKIFNTCTPIVTEKDVATFIQNIAGNFMGVVQYNDEVYGSVDINTLCGIMTNGTDVLTNYALVNNIFIQQQQPACTMVSYTDTLAQLQNLTSPSDGVGIRSWTYQTCAEFAYFQTTDSPASVQPFGDLVPLSYYTGICTDLFGFTGLPQINETNAYYGGNNPRGATRIVFVNGSIDPWHALGITKNLTESLTAVFITGTAHCANMFPATPHDPPGLAIAQQQISQQIGEWLANPYA